MNIKDFKNEVLAELKADIAAIESIGEEAFSALEAVFTKHAAEATTATENQAGSDALVVPAAVVDSMQAAAAGGVNTNGAPAVTGLQPGYDAAAASTDANPGNKQVLAPRGTPSNVHVEGTTCKPTGSVALPVNTEVTKPVQVAEADGAAGATEEGMKAGALGLDPSSGNADTDPAVTGIDPAAGGTVTKEEAAAGNVDPANNGTDAVQAVPVDQPSGSGAAQGGSDAPAADAAAQAAADQEAADKAAAENGDTK